MFDIQARGSIKMMMRRREFVVGCLSTAVAGEAFGHSCDVPSDVGAYYAAYLETVAARVRTNAQTCDTGFWFLTDPHVKANHRKSGRLCAVVRRLAAQEGRHGL